ncbi:MAG: hypothetical protein JWO11_1077 [Nocardioides sp.]|nr:hypothetical protein [Nocardioides sp.]
MSTSLRATAFVAGLAAFFALAFGVGRVVGPLDVEGATPHDMGSAGHDTSDAGGHAGMGVAAAPEVGGLQSSQDGYTLVLEDQRLSAGTRSVAFTISGPDGHPVTSYDERHEKDLHLIVVGRDLNGFQHVHPVLDQSGRWSTDVELAPGAWRVVADFAPAGGDPLVLGGDLLVPGRFAPAGLGPDRRTATVDGYDVTLDGDLVAGEESELTLTVRKDGRPVTDLDPYLGAFGHLVALRAGDLAYLHVHPDGGPGEVAPGPGIVFHAEVPSAGAYRLFLDFRHDGIVRTAAFTVRVGEGAGHEH